MASATLADAIQDWRDADTLKRPRGAEAPEYEAAGLTYKPANAPFQSVEELRLVLGMTPALYQQLAPLITIYSRQAGINSQIASRDVLRAVPNVTDAQIDEYLGLRETARANKQIVPVFAPASLYPAFGNGMTSIRASASIADGSSFIREAVVIRLPNPKRSYTFLRWQEGTYTEATASNSNNNALPRTS